MKKIVLLSLLLLSSMSLSAQGKFFKIYNDNGYDYGQGIVQLKDSSYLVTGSSSSFMDAPSQAYLMKIDKSGNHLWAKDYGFDEADGGKRVLSAFDDSIFFILGYTQSLSGNGFDVLLIKTDSNGVQLDKKVFGSTAWERINDAVIMGDSMIYAVGETTNTSTLNSNHFMMKIDMDLDTMWTKNWGSTGDDYLSAIRSFDANHFISVGAYYNIDSTMTKAYVSKLDFNGNVIWEKQYGANGDYWLNDFYLYNSGIYAVGGKHNVIYNDKDEFYLRINDDGTPNLWDFEAANEGYAEVRSAVLYAGNTKSYVAIEINNQYSAEHSYDVFFIRYENSLDYEWSNPSIPSVTVNFALDDQFGEMINTLDGAWVAVGSTPSMSNGGMAVYVIKAGINDNLPTVNNSSIQSLVEVVNIENTSLSIYPNPVESMLHIDGAEGLELFMYDVQGKLMTEQTLNGNSVISMESYEAGVYFVHFLSQTGERSCAKILKK